MYKNFTLTESEREQILNQHKSYGYKKPLNESHQGDWNAASGWSLDSHPGFAPPEHYRTHDGFDSDALESKEQINIISKGLIDMGLFEPFDLNGKMHSSFSKYKIAHNSDIRSAIDKIADENNIDSNIKRKYWHMFW